MPGSPFNEIGLLASSYAILAAALLPLLLAIRARVAPRPKPFRLRTFPELESLVMIALALLLPPLVLATLDTLGLFHGLAIANPVLQSSIAGVVSLAIWLSFVMVLLTKLGRDPLGSFTFSRTARDIAAGIIAFLLLTPVTFALHFAMTALVVAYGGIVERHPLQDFDKHTTIGVFLLAITACGVAPLGEEMIFRGLLLPWSRARQFRPWLIFALAVLMLVAGRRGWHLDTALFLVDLTLLMAFCFSGRRIWRKWPSRTASAVLSTSALFGAMHAAVWPTPVPLTVMGVGLAILTLRTGTVRPAIVAHALFNAVSVLALLRS